MTTVAQLEDMSTSSQTNDTSPETSIEIAGNHEITHKIDRLSLLPNELLDHIFDLAYSIDTPSTGALSKHLLPFHISGIYRRISLTDSDHIAKLVGKIGEVPGLAKTVKMLHVDAEEDETGVIEAIEATEIEQFFRQLVRLEWLDLGKDDCEWLDDLISTQSPTSLIPLRHITSGASNSSRPLLLFTSFPTLRSLHVTRYDDNYETPNASAYSPLPLLTHLTISGLFADDLSIASFCRLCPSLTHLTLVCRSPEYSNLLVELPSSLLRLELQCADDAPDWSCQRHLSRYTHLRHLVLGDGMFTSNLPPYLLGLQALEILELGEGQISTDGMRELFEKIPIVSLRLNLTVSKIGYRLEVSEDGSAEGRWVPGEGRLIVGDWIRPRFDLHGEGEFTLEGTRKMIGLAQEMGREVEGSIYKAIEVMDAYYLEIANIAIYRSFREKTFDPYLQVRTHNLGDRLPPLDLDSLDPNNLKLVKTDLPDEGWFALTLE